MIEVGNVSELTAAIASATPGTVIEVKAGTYPISGALRTQSAGAQGNPIVLRGAAGTLPKLDFSSTDEGVVLGHPDWTIENLWVNGACDGGGCGNDAGGVHIKAEATRVTVRQSRITNWTEDIKSDRSASAEPTDCTLIGNEIYNDSPGFTSGGTGIDLVGGLRWHIVGNYVHDYAREETHYGIFVKGGGKDAVIERNLVIGAKSLAAGSGSAVGISFGGGGTGTQYCASNNVGTEGCTCEAFGGIARNNIVAKTNDAGLHTKRACGSVFAYNTVYDTGIGLQIQIVGTTPVEVRGNVMTKGVSGAVTSDNNLLNVSAADFEKFYADPDAIDFRDGTDTSGLKGKGTALANVTDDYFGIARPAPPTLGAIELPTTGSTWPWNAGASADAGAPLDPDGGGSSSSSSGGGGGVSSSSGSSADPSTSSNSDDGGCSSTGARTGLGGLLAMTALVFALRRRR